MKREEDGQTLVKRRAMALDGAIDHNLFSAFAGTEQVASISSGVAALVLAKVDECVARTHHVNFKIARQNAANERSEQPAPLRGAGRNLSTLGKINAGSLLVPIHIFLTTRCGAARALSFSLSLSPSLSLSRTLSLSLSL